MINAYHAVALSFGYVEGNTVSWLIYKAEDEAPETRREAVHSLTEYLFQKYQYEMEDTADFCDKYKGHMALCCQKAWRRRDDNNLPERCPTCDANFNTKVSRKFSIDKWHQWLLELHASTCDSYGEHDGVPNPNGWSPWMYQFDVPQNQMVIIDENAEHILTEALAEIHPKLKDQLDDDDFTSCRYVPKAFQPERNSDDDPYFLSDYEQLCNESCVKIGNGYGHVKVKKDPSVTTTFNFPNGGQSVMVDGRYTYVKYNTGDQIFLEYKNNKYRVYKIIMYTGEEWIYDQDDHLSRHKVSGVVEGT